jgi:hypothetical protein
MISAASPQKSTNGIVLGLASIETTASSIRLQSSLLAMATNKRVRSKIV